MRTDGHGWGPASDRCHDERVPTEGITTRRSRPEDRDAVLALCRRALGWSTDDPDEAFFRWKHDENPWGPSPSWVAESDDGRLVGLRVFLRWGFSTPTGETLRMVRAVDTATDPDFQGRGIFTLLTTGALPDLRDDGVDAVFNTPNDKSRPGYLKMGWSVIGNVPVAARIGGPRSVRRVATARTAADLWSVPVTVGVDAAEAFADRDETDRLLAAATPIDGITTERSVEFLQWRYRFAPLAYRVLPLGDRLREGAIVFRVRRRGEALEATVCDVLAPVGARVAGALGSIRRGTGADYLLATAATSGLRRGFLPAPRLGPVLTWRPLSRPDIPDLPDLGLSLGDLELF